MRNLRRLPPLLRVAAIGGLALPVAGVILLSIAWAREHSQPFAGYDRLSYDRLSIIALTCLPLGLACTLVVGAYNTRVTQGGPRQQLMRLDSWPRQLRAIAVLAALPFCAIVLALIIPPTSTAFASVFLVDLLGALALLGTIFLWMVTMDRARQPQRR